MSKAEPALEEIIRLEFYHDPDPQRPTAYARFQNRMSRFHEEYGQWKTVVIDSVTFMELTALKNHQYVLNPFKMYAQGKDMRQWWGGTKVNLEEMLQMRFGSLPMHTVVCAHIDEDKDELNGEIIRSVACVGNLRRRLPAGYTEVYKHSIGKDVNGRFYTLQTMSDGRFIAVTRIGAPDPCEPSYEAIWQNYKGKERPSIHVLSYGDPGSGKSHFAATFPKPMLVFMFDPYGKEIPYLDVGEPGPLTAYEDGTPVRSVFAKR